MDKIDLEWHKIVNIDELISIENELKGMSAIYVWGWLDMDKEFVPYYIGKSGNLRQRLFDHLGKLKGGMSSIYSTQYSLSKDFTPLNKQDGNELLYVPSTIRNWQDVFLSDKVQENLKWLLKNLMFSWCKTESKDNVDLERLIFNLINANNGTPKVGAKVPGKPELTYDDVSFSGDETLKKLCTKES